MWISRELAGAANCGQSMDAGKGKHTLQQQPIINSTDAVPHISFASHQQVPCALEPCRRASASSGVAAADIDLAAARIPPCLHEIVCLDDVVPLACPQCVRGVSRA